MSVLEFGPPQIPLRISSIPVNAKPRKLSLPSQKSYSMLKAEEKENIVNHSVAGPGGTKSPPPLMTMKELPSPPVDDLATRHAVMGSEPQEWSTSPPPTRESSHAELEGMIPNPVIPISPPPRSARRARSHSRLHSAPPTSSFPPPPSADNKTRNHFADFDWTPSPKPKKEKGKAKVRSGDAEEGGWAAATKSNEGRPMQMSRTQREKERKKRGKARIVIEHVDIIRDEFWERRPWILSGRAG